MESDPVFGVFLDFSNNNTIVSMFDGDSVKIIKDPKGNYNVPFYVAFTDTSVIIGKEAQKYKSEDPENCIYDIGKFIGKQFTDEELTDFNKEHLFKLVIEDGILKVRVKYMSIERNLPVSYILGMFLNKLIKTAIGYANLKKIKGIVVTQPDNFQKEASQELIDALKYTQYKLLRVCPERHALTSAYGVSVKEDQKMLLCHLREGKSIVQISSKQRTFRSSIETRLIDTVIKYCEDQLKQQYGCDITKDDFLCKKLKDESYKAIEELMTAEKYVVKIENTILRVTITREIFETLCDQTFTNALRIVIKHYQETVAVEEKTTHVLFAGNYSLLPRVRQIFFEMFDEASLFLATVPELVFAHGAVLFSVKNPVNSGNTVTLMKYSAKLENITKEESSDDESIVIISSKEAIAGSESDPKNNSAETEDTEDETPPTFKELSNNLRKYKDQIDDISNFLTNDAKQIADDHFTYLTKWMIDCKNVADIHVIERQQKHLKSIMDPLIHDGQLAKENYELLECLINDEYMNKHYSNVLKDCNKILRLKHLTDEEKEKWEKFRDKVLFEQKEAEKIAEEQEKVTSNERETFVNDICKASDEESYDTAIEICDTALLTFPSDEEILYFRAHSLKELSKYPEAIRDFTKVIQQNKSHMNAFLHRGKCHYSCKAFKKALDDFNNYVQLGGEKSKNLASLIEKTELQYELQRYDEYMDQKDFSRAQDILHKMDLDQLEEEWKVEIFIRRAKFWLQNDNEMEAIRQIDVIIKEYPEYCLEALKLRAKWYESQEDLVAAIEDLKIIYEMEPNAENQHKLQRLKKERGIQQKQEYFKSQYNIKL